MADELDLEKAKAAAAAKAKAAAAAKAKAAALAKAGASETPVPPVEAASTEPKETAAPATTEASAPADGDDLAAAKAKAIAAAKAKAAAAAAAKAKALGQEPAADAGTSNASAQSTDNADDAKAKAIAAAKAKAAAVAAAKAKAAGASATEASAPVEEEKPSKNRPTLDLIVKKITDTVGADAIEESYINFLGKEVPTLVIRKERLLQVADILYNDSELDFKYLSNLHGIDHETHMEVYYYLQSYTNRFYLALRVKTDRDGGKVPSVTSLWYGANWQERESYDLFGIDFEGHPNMVRMFLPENWVGHPLRKDYVQFDEEV